MRKSLAPSFRLDSSIKIPPGTKMRSVDDILKLLNKNEDENKPINEELANRGSPSSTNTVCDVPLEEKSRGNVNYSVVWGKKTTKKHKTFEEDGTLKIVGKSASLFDSEGSIVGRTDNINLSTVTEGAVLSIGSKEVQIIETISEAKISAPMPQKIINKHNSQTLNTSIKDKSMIRPSTSFQKWDQNINTTNDNLRNDVFAKRFYNIVWGKKSSKKHKTFEGDGTLEIFGKSLILRDTDGSILGKSENIDTSAFAEDSIISVGNKEVQIIEAVSKPMFTSNSKSLDNCDEPQIKRMKMVKRKTFTSCAAYPKVASGLKTKTFNLDFEPLVMPEPNEEHQWLHNTSKQPLRNVSVDPCLVKVLRPHQKEGVIFLYRCLMGFYGEHLGAVLADEMGLGKTLQCITLTWTLLKQGPYGDPTIKNVMVVAPSSLCTNWKDEFMRWLGLERICCFLVDAKNKPKDYAKLTRVPVMIISYEMVTRYIDDIKNIPFDLLICDEGHRLKNTSIKISTQLMQIECKRRIIVTGTPIQNDLQEFYSIINFVNPGILGSINEFRGRYLDPIMASQQLQCSVFDKNLGETRAKQLHDQTSNFILRRTQEIIDKYLPKKQEIVLFCKISDLQQKLYKAALVYYENRKSLENNDVVHLQLINYLKKICNHPFLISEGENEYTGDLKHHLLKILKDHTLDMNDSGKIRIVQKLMKSIFLNREKIVLVSYFTQTLDMLAEMCDNSRYSFLRLDGTTPSGDRQKIIDQFNSPHSTIHVFLLSAKAGGVGLNITGASRLVLFDTNWNPATDLQAMSRIWRDGQKKSVYIYRLITTGTIEEKMYQRQMAKTSLSGAIVDMHNESTNVKYSQEYLRDIFTLTENKCSTHDILQCTCICDGKIPTPPDENKTEDEPVEERSCQISLNSSANVNNLKKSLRMHELLQWEHHKQPIAPEALKNMGLEDAGEDIFFIFRNQGTY